MVIFFDRLKFSLGEAGVFIATWISLIVIERSSPIKQFHSGFALDRPYCNWARKSY